MDEKITIIEGPPPVFEAAGDGWVSGVSEGSHVSYVAVTRLRTYNGPALIERCYRAWHKQEPIHLEFRANDGLERSAPIIAARHVEVDEGQMLLLWVRLEEDDVTVEIDYKDDEEDDDNSYNEDSDLPDLTL